MEQLRGVEDEEDASVREGQNIAGEVYYKHTT